MAIINVKLKVLPEERYSVIMLNTGSIMYGRRRRNLVRTKRDKSIIVPFLLWLRELMVTKNGGKNKGNTHTQERLKNMLIKELKIKKRKTKVVFS